MLHIPESLKPYVNNYRINLFDIPGLDDETVNKFKSDFRVIADYFVQIRRTGEYHPGITEIRHVPETIHLIEVLTGNKMFETEYKKRLEKGKEVHNMRDVFADFGEKCRDEGRKESILEMAMKMLKDSQPMNIIMKYTGLSEEEIREASAQQKVMNPAN